MKYPISQRKRKDMILKQKIMEIYNHNRKTYGSSRIHQKLVREDYLIDKKRVERLMQELDICAIAKKKYRATTDSRHTQPVAENHLNREFKPDKPNSSWLADITYIYTREGWLYLATIIDLYSRKIIGWFLRDRLTKELVIAALYMALKQRKLSQDLLLHSDRGSQYASELYQTLLERNGILCSMSGKGNCFRQCSDGEFLSHLKDRTDLSEKVRNKNRSPKRYIRIYRNILQQGKITFFYGVS
jgi:transposase InsO family protein